MSKDKKAPAPYSVSPEDLWKIYHATPYDKPKGHRKAQLKRHIVSVLIGKATPRVQAIVSDKVEKARREKIIDGPPDRWYNGYVDGGTDDDRGNRPRGADGAGTTGD